MQLNWREQAPGWPPALQQLMTETGSFTEALIARLGPITVRPLLQHWQTVRGEEASALGFNAPQPCYVREVVLCRDELAVIFARTVIPARSLLGPNRELTQLGGRALGALLFAGDGVRETLQYRSLDGRELLARRLLQLQLPWQRGIPARRSRFLLRGAPLLVHEVALPALARLL
ncbi:chorismate lyase [Permianibacter sp. IMCC34836]|uniref:chorismate--pyruvate lyase family protein n=1 Tax=Permianibacter fluminis TaxID=2738515 RepID=UPI00155611E3|nr:chorismate lyase [Permianibacter fluminis]NQD35422.1 chorismate lyase [Permianibacter fluminis]